MSNVNYVLTYSNKDAKLLIRVPCRIVFGLDVSAQLYEGIFGSPNQVPHQEFLVAFLLQNVQQRIDSVPLSRSSNFQLLQCCKAI